MYPPLIRVMMRLLQMKNLLPSLEQQTDFVVAAFSSDMLPNAMKVCRTCSL